jgi:hypothetical protein
VTSGLVTPSSREGTATGREESSRRRMRFVKNDPTFLEKVIVIVIVKDTAAIVLEL